MGYIRIKMPEGTGKEFWGKKHKKKEELIEFAEKDERVTEPEKTEPYGVLHAQERKVRELSEFGSSPKKGKRRGMDDGRGPRNGGRDSATGGAGEGLGRITKKKKEGRDGEMAAKDG